MLSVPPPSYRLRHVPRLAIGALVLVGLLGSQGARATTEADAFDAQTKADLQSVITKQLDAFAHNDAKAAEEFAAPEIKRLFSEPTQFLDMVKSQYGALIHPRSTQFLGVASSPHGPLQKVTIVAADGTVWSAIYSFERVEGQWRITGCGLQKDATQQEI